jgi:hypothetical protein
MKIDLAALRALIEEEIGRVEQKKVRLQQQLQHIAAVEEIAQEAGSSLQIGEEPEAPSSDNSELSEQSRRWFQQV